MFFSKIRGHGETISNFKKWVIEERFKGVYLFHGPRGVGKHTTAHQLSKYLCCTGTKDDSCHCENCKLFPNIPDFLSIDDSASSIKVSEVEGLGSFLDLVPYRSSKRVVLIDDLERASTRSFNRLLKNLEEVKDHTIIILVTSHLDRIPDTVHSRSRLIEFGSLSPEDILDILKGLGHSFSYSEDLKRVIPWLNGSILQDFSRYQEYLKKIPKFVNRFPNMDEDDWITELDEVDSAEESLYFLEVLFVFMNDILKVHCDSPDTLVNSSKLDQIEATSLIWDSKSSFFMVNKLRGLLEEYKLGLNISIKPRLQNILSWSYVLLKKEQLK